MPEQKAPINVTPAGQEPLVYYAHKVIVDALIDAQITELRMTIKTLQARIAELEAQKQ